MKSRNSQTEIQATEPPDEKLLLSLLQRKNTPADAANLTAEDDEDLDWTESEENYRKVLRDLP